MKELIISSNEAGQRLDKFLLKYLPLAGKGFIYKMLRKKNIVLNDKKAQGNEILQISDRVRLWISDETIAGFSKEDPENMTGCILKLPGDLSPFKIVYEDKDILIINKPAGMLSQKARESDISANEYLLSYMLENREIFLPELKTFRPAFCNRLDRNTSGLLVAGKSLKGLQDMSEAFRERKLHKDYLAVVSGAVREGRILEGYIIKDEISNRVSVNAGNKGDYIKTEFKPLYTDGKNTLLFIRLHTGKTHQIRAHLAYAGHPIVGDAKHGKSRGGRQLLHAFRLTFPDGRKFEAQVPEDIKKEIRGYKWEPGKPEALEDLPSRI